MFRSRAAAPLALALVLCPAAATSQPTSPVALTLTAPTGALPIGVVERHLVDSSRADPWFPDRRREVMISIWYPAVDKAVGERASYIAAAPARLLAESLLRPIGVDPARINIAELETHATAGAAARRGRYPVVIYSPGGGLPRALGTTLVEDLASRGYVVVTIDHPSDANAVEFPGGRVVLASQPSGEEGLRRMMAARVGDAQFVLDELEKLRKSRDGRALASSMDLSRIGMFGHSAGGFAAFETALIDRRFDAVANLDGSLGYAMSLQRYGDVVEKGLNRPFMIVGAGVSGPQKAPHNHLGAREWGLMWDHSTGWKRDYYIAEGEHMAFADHAAVLPQIAAGLRLPPVLVTTSLGKADPMQQVAAQRGLVAAFFDQHLKKKKQPLLDAAAPFPIVQRID